MTESFRKTLKIITKHTFTLFNFVNLVLALMIIFTGSFKNLLFIFIAIANTLISIINELRAKKIVDHLKLISAKRPEVERNGKIYEITPEEVKKGDLLILKLGDQVLFDSIIEEGSIEVNESFLTGESENVTKRAGQELLSGSFVVSGLCKAKVLHIGAENSLSKIEQSAQSIKTEGSQLFRLMNKIIKYISYALIPIGVLLLWARFRVPGTTQEVAVTSTVAALINMIPEGLILLTSSILALATIRLSRQKVLVQDLYSIETLARVDCIALDKTGTLTTGNMTVRALACPVKGELVLDNNLNRNRASGSTPESPETPAKNALLDALELILGVLPADNATSQALHKAFVKKAPRASKAQTKPASLDYDLIPFSSERKYSGIESSHESYLLGALEFITKDKALLAFSQYLPENYRALSLIHRKNNKDTLLGFILLEDELRSEAKNIINYFYDNNIEIKIISGDNLNTVTKIAAATGVKQPHGVDLSTVKQKDYANLVKKYNIFTRVTPEQKKSLIAALKKHGHTVAMTGDGVNDILAMKEADCSIAIGDGSDAARRSAKLVLLNSDFSAVPTIINEGRQSINNLERSTTLFITKTVYASILALVFVFIPLEYPFSPISMSLLNFLCIGLPGFALALEKNTSRIKNQFISNIKRYSVPTGILISIAVLIISIVARIHSFPRPLLTTLSVSTVFFFDLVLLYRISRPLNHYRRILLIFIALVFLGILFIPHLNAFFEFTPLI